MVKDPSTKVHIKAMQLSSPFFSCLLFTFWLQFYQFGILMSSRKLYDVLLIMYPSIHSCILIWGNRKLTQAFLSFLWQSRCWLKERCRGPAWGTPPMAKVTRNEAWHTQRRDQASGNPLFPSIYPQSQSLFYALTYTSDFTGGSPPLPFLSEKELTCSSKAIKIPGHDKSVSAYRLLWRLSSPPV